MAKLQWNKSTERLFETGVDRGVFYPPTGAGEAWNGLKSVSETPDDGDANSYFVDGMNELNAFGFENFAAKVESLTEPTRFGSVIGNTSILNGLVVEGQSRKTFGFSYRTRIGNDVVGSDFAYYIHLVYNAMVTPDDRSYSTVDSSIDPEVKSWNIDTTPLLIPGYVPSAHFKIDSRNLDEYLLQDLEAIIYGAVASEPRLPTADELLSLFSNWRVILDNGDGTWTAIGPDNWFTWISGTEVSLNWPSASYIDANTYQISSVT